MNPIKMYARESYKIENVAKGEDGRPAVEFNYLGWETIELIKVENLGDNDRFFCLAIIDDEDLIIFNYEEFIDITQYYTLKIENKNDL